MFRTIVVVISIQIEKVAFQTDFVQFLPISNQDIFDQQLVKSILNYLFLQSVYLWESGRWCQSQYLSMKTNISATCL